MARPNRPSLLTAALPTAAALVVLPLLAACASDAPQGPPPSRSPAWLARSSQLADEGDRRVLFAVGRADADADRATQRQLAEKQAKIEMAKGVRLLVERMVRQYMGAHSAYYEPMDPTAADEYTEDVCQEVADDMAERAKPWDDYHDPIGKEYFVRLKMDLADVLASYRDRMTRAYERELLRERVAADAEAFAVDLESQLETLEGLSAGQLDDLLAGR